MNPISAQSLLMNTVFNGFVAWFAVWWVHRSEKGTGSRLWQLSVVGYAVFYVVVLYHAPVWQHLVMLSGIAVGALLGLFSRGNAAVNAVNKVNQNNGKA